MPVMLVGACLQLFQGVDIVCDDVATGLLLMMTMMMLLLFFLLILLLLLLLIFLLLLLLIFLEAFINMSVQTHGHAAQTSAG